MDDQASPESSARLVARWREGDQQAAAELWQRYALRLVALARSRLSGQMTRHVDPEDVVQSAYRRFFTGARSDRYVLQQSGDLWRLLVAITLRKVQDQFKRHARQKRDHRLEQSIDQPKGKITIRAELLARDPSPDDAAALTDELDDMLRGLEPAQRQMVGLRLQGYNLEEIANLTERHERTVRRVLTQFKDQLRQRCEKFTGS